AGARDAGQCTPHAIDVVDALRYFGTLGAPADFGHAGDRAVADIAELAAFSAQNPMQRGRDSPVPGGVVVERGIVEVGVAAVAVPARFDVGPEVLQAV